MLQMQLRSVQPWLLLHHVGMQESQETALLALVTVCKYASVLLFDHQCKTGNMHCPVRLQCPRLHCPVRWQRRCNTVGSSVANCLTSGAICINSSRLSPGMILTLTGPLARTDAQRTAAVANWAISPTNWPSDLTATRNSLGPLESVVAKS